MESTSFLHLISISRNRNIPISSPATNKKHRKPAQTQASSVPIVYSISFSCSLQVLFLVAFCCEIVSFWCGFVARLCGCGAGVPKMYPDLKYCLSPKMSKQHLSFYDFIFIFHSIISPLYWFANTFSFSNQMRALFPLIRR